MDDLTRAASYGDREKEKEPIPCLFSSRSVVQRRCQPTPTKPTLLGVYSMGGTGEGGECTHVVHGHIG